MSTHARELDTNLDTVLGTDIDAPWVQEKISKMEGEDFHEHQPSDEEPLFQVHPREAQEDEEDVQEFVPTEAEKDAADRLRSMNKEKAAKAAKRPRSPPVVDDDEVPDLAEIFDNYDTPHSVRISICRAYASYIASLQPKRAKPAPKKRQK